MVLQRTLNLTATQATGADIQMAHSTVQFHTNPLGIRQENSISLAVRMADMVTTHCALTANLTNLAHQ